MIVAQSKIAIKVGSKSTSRFRNAKVYRAITVKELVNLNETQNPDIIVIENISEHEYSDIVSFLGNFSSQENKFVFFFVPDNDEVTTGAADELNLDIYLDIKDLYRAININCGVNVDIDISLNKNKSESLEDDPFESGFEDPFSDAIQASNEAYKSSEFTQISEVNILNRAEAGMMDSDEDLGIITTGESKILDNSDSPDTSDSVSKQEDTQEECEEAVPDNYIKLKEELSLTAEKLAKSEELNNKLSGQAKEAVDRVLNLNKVIKAIKDERDTFRSELKSLEEADIIEDPATLTEYNMLKDKIAELEESLANSSNKSNDEVNELITERDKLITELAELKSKYIQFEDRISELEIDNDNLTRKLQIATDDVSKDNEIADLKNQVISLSEDIQGLNEKLDEASNTLNSKLSEIEELKSKKQAEVHNRQHIIYLLEKAVIKLQTVYMLQHEVDTLRSANDELEQDITQLKAELTDKQARLDKVMADTETRVSLARNYVQEELENVKRENSSLRTRLDIITSQYNAKDAQYNTLIQTCGIDENGAMAIVDTNKTLESINNTLRAKLADLTTAYEIAEKEKVEAKNGVVALKEQNGKLATQLRAMSSGYSGGGHSGIISPIQYDRNSNRAQVICVFGSGSYGITTTAYTTAQMLSGQGRTLFIDFDMVSPKADSWFRVNPIVNSVMGIDPQDRRNTGLGIMINRGTPFFLANAMSIIQRISVGKNGCIDYLSGIYASFDVVKIVSADFSGMMNYFGNSYDYIVIDFGRLGTSDINNQLIKVFSDIARSNIMVTSSDRIDIRNGRMAIEKVRINMMNMGWLINLAENTKIDDNTKARVSPAVLQVMPFIDDFYGKRQEFNRNKLSRDKFSLFLDNAVLRR